MAPRRHERGEAVEDHRHRRIMAHRKHNTMDTTMDTDMTKIMIIMQDTSKATTTLTSKPITHEVRHLHSTIKTTMNLHHQGEGDDRDRGRILEVVIILHEEEAACDRLDTALRLGEAWDAGLFPAVTQIKVIVF